MYAWSRIAKTVNEWGQVEEWIEPGDSISQSDINVSDTEWEELQANGAVRKEKYPNVGSGMSPAEHFRQNPDEAPEVDVDEETPQPEAMRHTDAGMAMGLKPPGAGDAEEAAKKQEAANKEQNTPTGGSRPTT